MDWTCTLIWTRILDELMRHTQFGGEKFLQIVLLGRKKLNRVNKVMLKSII